MSGEEGIPIPVTLPGGEEVAQTFLRIAAGVDKLNDTLGKTKPKADDTGAALAKIGASASASEKLLRSIHDTGSAGMQALTEKATQLGRKLGGDGLVGDLAEVGVKGLAAFDGLGLGLTATIGLAGILYQAWEKHEQALERVASTTRAVSAETARLGGSYATVLAAIDQTKTAEQNLQAIRAASLAVLQQQISFLQEGYSPDAARNLTGVLDRLRATEVELHGATGGATEAMIRHALESGNAAEQQRVLGVSFAHSADAAQEQINVTNAGIAATARASEAVARHKTELNEAAVARRRAAQAAVDGLSEEAAASAAGDRAERELRDATEAAAIAYRNMNAATAEAARLQPGATQATHDLAAATEELRRNEQLLAEGRTLKAKNDEIRARNAGGPTAAEQRASVEALRVAREAVEQSGHTLTVTEQQAVALRALASAQNEVRLAEAAAARGGTTLAERNALTAALTEQTRAEAALHAVSESDAQAARARVATQDAETRALQTNNAAKADAARASDALAGAAQAQARAQEDAQALAERALETSRVLAANDNDQYRLLNEQTEATRALAAANRELVAIQDEVARSGNATLEQRQRLTAATQSAATATTRQHDATRAVNAEASKIKTDTIDSLTESAKGLAGGLLSTAIAAGIAGKAVDDAERKQLAASLASLSAEAAQRALFAAATAIFYAATGNYAGAAQAAVSAGIFTAVAVGAGVGSSLVAPGTAPTAAGDGAASTSAGGTSDNQRAAPVSARDAAGNGGGVVINVDFGRATIIGSGGARQAAREIAGVLNTGARQGGITLTPQLLGGARR